MGWACCKPTGPGPFEAVAYRGLNGLMKAQLYVLSDVAAADCRS